MSYLDLPRIHFAGLYRTDPSTVNNARANYASAAAAAANPAWNAGGRHHFQFANCRIRSTFTQAGALATARAQDSLITGQVVTTDSPRAARLVDLDPEHQTGSQIWGMELRIEGATGEGFTATFDTATLQQLWFGRTPDGFPKGLGGVYQSALTNLRWSSATAPFQSIALNEFFIKSGTRASIKFVLYAYDGNPASPTFTQGSIVGTIGPAAAGELSASVAGRKLRNAASVVAGQPPPFGDAPFIVDTARKRLIIDLGNAMPEQSPAGPRVNVGTLEAQIEMPAPAAPLRIGAITYDKAHYETTAGIEELPLTQQQLTEIVRRPVRLRASSPARIILGERADGLHMGVSETVFRMNPGETRDVVVEVRQRGAPKNNQPIVVALLSPASSTGLSLTGIVNASSTPMPLASPMTAAGTPAPSTIRTSPGGAVILRFTASAPGNPRGLLDGQVYKIALFVDSVSTPNLMDQIVVRVFDTHAMVASPRWADVAGIFTPYHTLYPSMRPLVPLNDQARVTAMAALVAASMQRPETDPGYMPVSRDLSRDKKALLLRWLNNGAPP